ncbi:MAG: hypothetical protein L6R35_005087 [Caloplaca aegaea]|nr:MAG: hypothetical protein L6R35_005087 [Caloplaca aegaea]
MLSSSGMETLEARLQSFNIAHPSTKKRTSNTKVAAKLTWPHEVPDPAQLAKAGFYYKPSSAAPDNTVCYLCHSSLDGWEENDSPVGEHLSFSPDCGWAVIARIEQDIDDGKMDQQDPMDESLVNARKMTFGINWPHEDKRGWVCKTQKVRAALSFPILLAKTPKTQMVEAGCDEHQRRSPLCMFFAPSESTSKKAARGKKGRHSKASRLSTQSNLTTASEGVSLVDLNLDEDTAASLQKHQPLKNSTIMMGAKKVTKGRKTAPKPKRKASTTQPDATIPSSSFVEPEDDDFEVKVEQGSSERVLGKKRKSDEMSIDDDSMQAGLKQDQEMPQIPPIKRRATRGSVSHTNGRSESVTDGGQNDDSRMTDVEILPRPPPPASKRKAKAGKRKASSSVRKASTTSTASKASLRATIPDDADIDAALEADLDRPLTDNEAEPEPPTQKTKTRRLTKTRPGSRNTTASTAPVRRATRASALPADDGAMTGINATMNNLEMGTVEEPNAVQIILTAMDHAEQEIIADTDKHKASTTKRGSGALSKVENTATDDRETERDIHSLNLAGTVNPDLSIVTATTEIQESYQQPGQLPEPKLRDSAVSVGTLEGEEVPESNTSTVAPAMSYENAGGETQDSLPNQNRIKRVGRPRGAAAKKGKAAKKAAVTNRNEEDAVLVADHRHEPVELVEGKLPEKNGEPLLPIMPQAQESLEGKAKGAKGRNRNAAKSKRSETMPPSEPGSIPLVESAEVPSPTTHEHDAAESMSMPGDFPGHEDYQKSPARSVTPQAQAPSPHQTPKTANSPQSSDVENQPPSARPSALRPPLVVQTPSKIQATLVPLAATTPKFSPSKRDVSRLQSTLPWTSIDFEKVFGHHAADKENLQELGVNDPKQALSSPEKKLTVEEWIQWNAKRGEEKLRDDCERLVGRFEGEGVRALKTLEGITCAE